MLQLRITVGLKQIVSILGICFTKINQSNNKYHKECSLVCDHQRGMTYEYNQRWSEYIQVSFHNPDDVNFPIRS
jgi:hypothetical protein